MFFWSCRTGDNCFLSAQAIRNKQPHSEADVVSSCTMPSIMTDQGPDFPKILGKILSCC